MHTTMHYSLTTPIVGALTDSKYDSVTERVHACFSAVLHVYSDLHQGSLYVETGGAMSGGANMVEVQNNNFCGSLVCQGPEVLHMVTPLVSEKKRCCRINCLTSDNEIAFNTNKSSTRHAGIWSYPFPHVSGLHAAHICVLL
jgi:hypothetical protein